MPKVNWPKRIDAYKSGEPIPYGVLCRLRHMRMADVRRGLDDGSFPCHLGCMSVEWNIFNDQAAKGLKWLHRKDIWRLIRPEFQAIINNFHSFKFLGFFNDGDPNYLVLSKDGKSFRYSPNIWDRNRAIIYCSKD